MSPTKDNDKVLLSRPKDKTFEAFKAWFGEMRKHLTGRDEPDGTVTDESLRALWHKFWKGDVTE